MLCTPPNQGLACRGHPLSIRVEVVFLLRYVGHLSASREYPRYAVGLAVPLEAARSGPVAEVLAEIHGVRAT